MNERIAIDSTNYALIQEGGLRPPHLRLNYASEQFQDIIHQAFGDLFPRIRFNYEGNFWHENFDEESRETTSLSKAFADNEAWPSHEIDRLLDGWMQLQAITARISDLPLKSMLLCLQLPDPIKDARCYRHYIDVNGVQRMHILYGFIPNAKHTPYLAETLFEELERRNSKPSAKDHLSAARSASTRESIDSETHTSLSAEITAHNQPANSDGATNHSGTRRKCPLHEEIHPAYSLSCIISLSLVFVAYFVTTVPCLMAKQIALSESSMDLPVYRKAADK